MEIVNEVFLVATVAIVFSNVVAAADQEEGKVLNIDVNDNGNISVWLDGPNQISTCAGGARWTININTDLLYKEQYSAILSAAMAGKQ